MHPGTPTVPHEQEMEMALQREQWLTFVFLALAGLALLAMGALKVQRDFLTRGIPTALPEPITEGGVRPGINVNLAQYDDVELAHNLAQIEEIGIGYLKHSFYYDEAFDWQESDRIVAAVTERGLALVPLLDGNPDDNFAPPNTAEFAAWAGAFAARYADWLHYYIIWDEPNLASHWGNQPVNPAEYGALLTAASQAINSADPNAIIIAAPLAPTTETGPDNLADPLYLDSLYESGAGEAFDIAAAKPYGFDTGPGDRTVARDTLNFSRAILLREIVVQNGDAHKALWAGNWGWNSLPATWQGAPSLWGQTSAATQAEHTVAALERARKEWPWMGVMFLENWQPDVPADDPRWGFSIAGRGPATANQATASAIQAYQSQRDDIAYPGFHPPQPHALSQKYSGEWRFLPEFGADIGQAGDQVQFTFWGTDVGLRVRQANYQARLYVTVDGRPANNLPPDEHGSMLILTAADPDEEMITTELVARNLPAGRHTLTAVATGGWEQWALKGFSTGYRPPDSAYKRTLWGLGILAVLSLLLARQSGRQANWGGLGRTLRQSYHRLSQQTQIAITAVAAAIVALTGWLTWGAAAAGIYRRLGTGSQLAFTAAAASIFYVTPTFIVYVAALAVLFLLIYFRPPWGLALIAFSFPLYVSSVVKPVFSYRFSPLEIFTLITFAAFLAARLTAYVSRARAKNGPPSPPALRVSLHPADYAVLAFVAVATLSLLFTERLDVATNEWRMIILEPALFYGLLRAIRPSKQEMWVVVDAFVLGGLAIALLGLGQYFTGQNQLLITAEGGLMRVRSIYGSPNNLALYLGRIFPLLLAMLLLGKANDPKRRWSYGVALIPIGLALLLTYSRGALVLGVPAASLFVFWHYQRTAGRRTWPWLIVFALLGAIALLVVQQIPQLAGRFNLQGATSAFRLNLWQASINMFVDHPWLGVGLDNFLYQYRGRYILEAAWREPNLNHPHNIVLDLATRLGLLGLLAGGWLFWTAGRILKRLPEQVTAVWVALAVGLGGAFIEMVTHGLVDHSFFLADLSFVFYLMLGTAVWLQRRFANPLPKP